MTPEERADTDRLSKLLIIWIAGFEDAKEYKEQCGCSIEYDWNLMPEWEKDDYRNAALKFTKEIMDIFEEVNK